MSEPGDPRPLIAYASNEANGTVIRPAPRQRPWLDTSPAAAGKRCLPLLVANEAGWEILNPVAFRATWSGAADRAAICVEAAAGGVYRGPAHSGFGAGILSLSVPFLFRTPSGWNLHVRGPANRPKDGIAPLEGVIEADWSVATFTMNWQMTRPGTVCFAAGEPFCLVVPQQRGVLASFAPELRRLSTDPVTHRRTREFVAARREEQQRRFLAENGYGDLPPFNRQYFRGRYPDGTPAPDHETQLRLRPFRDARNETDGAGAPTSPPASGTSRDEPQA